MSSVVRVPPELASFLSLGGAQSLLIRGPPGSGKSMLSLALLETFAGRRVYVSLRVTRKSLLDQVPWLGRIPPGEIEIVDATAEASHIEQHASAVPAVPEVIADEEGAREAREFVWLPRAAQAAWSLADPARPTLIVFDPWDAVVDQYFERVAAERTGVPSRSEVERTLLGRMAQANVTLVLVLERDSPTVLDYQVNGIVETYRRLEEGRLERWVGFPKLRGVEIGTDTYPFTLARGRFAAITPTPPNDHYELRAPTPDPEPEKSGLWPGATDYAESLGRLLDGELTILELEPTVPREVPRAIIGPMVISALRERGRVLLFAPPSTDPADAYVELEAHVPKDALRARLRVLTPLPLDAAALETSATIVPPHRIGWTKTGPPVPLPDDPTFLHEARSSASGNLIVAYLSGLETLAESSGVTLSRGTLAAIAAATLPRSRVHLVAVCRSGDALLSTISAVAETHLRVRSPHGRVFFNGYRPYLPPLVLSQEGAGEPYRLTRVL